MNFMSCYKSAIELTYSDICTVTEYEKYTKENKTTGQREVIKYEGVPCRLSHERGEAAFGTGTFTRVSQGLKLFISPDIKILPGSKITVEYDGQKVDFKQSGFPAVYVAHQEIPLELFDERA